MVLGIQILIKDALKLGTILRQAITLSGMRTSGVCADWLWRMLKSDCRHVKECCFFLPLFQIPAKLATAGAARGKKIVIRWLSYTLKPASYA